MTEHDWLQSDDPAALLAYLRGSPLDNGANIPPTVLNRKLRLFAVACCRAVWDGAKCPRCLGMGCSEDHRYTPAAEVRCPACHGTGRVGGLQDPRSRAAVEVAERYADGEAAEEELLRVSSLFAVETESEDEPPQDAKFAAWWSVNDDHNLAMNTGHYLQRFSRLGMPPATQAALLRDIFGNPFRPVTMHPNYYEYTVAWRKRELMVIAHAIYDERRWDELPILADALSEAGLPEGGICPRCHGGGNPCQWCDGSGEVGPHPLLAHLRSPGPHAKGCWAVDLVLGKE